MKFKYLQNHHLTQISDYCKKRCIDIVIKHHNENELNIQYYRGLYSGYIYIKKLCRLIRVCKKSISNKELYEHLKYKKIYCDNHKGIITAFHDIRNLLLDL
jgi:hypothetical protein